MKTKMGISVGLMAAMVYFTALFGGYVAVIVLAGYVLLMEENEWLKRSAVKAVVMMVCFSVVLDAIGLIPDFFSWIGSVVSVFSGSFKYSVVSSIIAVITKAIDIVRTIFFLLLGLQAMNQGSMAIPSVDKIVDKHMQ